MILFPFTATQKMGVLQTLILNVVNVPVPPGGLLALSSQPALFALHRPGTRLLSGLSFKFHVLMIFVNKVREIESSFNCSEYIVNMTKNDEKWCFLRKYK